MAAFEPISVDHDSCVNVGNDLNTKERWQQSVSFYRKSCESLRSLRTAEKCRCIAIIDVSSSMEGRRLTAVKLGLCSLLANLADGDELCVSAFAREYFPVTNGISSIDHLNESFPTFLERLKECGSTAFYDAVVEGMRDLKVKASSSSEGHFKNISIVLTDGEDNESSKNARIVEQHLCNPGINTFMFILVAVSCPLSRRIQGLNY